jgi:hypothetical protein
MYLLAAAVVEATLLVQVAKSSMWGFFVASFACCVYYMWYTDGREYTGEGRWEAFRSLRAWAWISPVELIGSLATNNDRRLLVMVPACATPVPLIWGIGLHGGRLATQRPLHYVLPAPFFWVPLVRECLLWTGAVAQRPGVVVALLQQGRNVCYSPSPLGSANDDVEAALAFPSDEILQLTQQERIGLTVVTVQRERERMVVINVPPQLRRVVHDYPFPFIYWPKRIAVRIEVQVGVSIDPTAVEGVQDVKWAIQRAVERTAVPLLQDKLLKAN